MKGVDLGKKGMFLLLILRSCEIVTVFIGKSIKKVVLNVFPLELLKLKNENLKSQQLN